MIIKIAPTQKKFARPFTGLLLMGTPLTGTHLTGTHLTGTLFTGMLFTFVMTFIISTPVNAEIYRVVDAEGKVTFTDQPPANSNHLIETVADTDPEQNITPSPKSLAEDHPEWLKAAQEKRAQAAKHQQHVQHSEQQQRRQDWKRELKAAKANV